MVRETAGSRSHVECGKSREDGCGRCHKTGVPLYENSTAPGEMLDFPCLLIVNPRQVARYPGWREREQRREQRAQIARENFRLEA